MKFKTNYVFKTYYKNSYSKLFLTNIKTKGDLNKNKLHLRLSLKPFSLILFKRKIKKFNNPTKSLALNFKRNRFFPNLRTIKGENYMFLSLGMFSKFFTKTKSFIKSKTMYLLLASFLRKILIFSKFKNMSLIISKIPVFLKEILSVLNDPVVNVYKNPFTESWIYEKSLINQFKFSYILFLNNKSHGSQKLKKKGRLKRKITKKIILSNRMVD